LLVGLYGLTFLIYTHFVILSVAERNEESII